MTKDEALKRALEALKCAKVTTSTPGNFLFFEEAITAIKEYMAQPEQEPVAWISENAGLYHFKPDKSLNPLPLYLAPPPCPTCEALARTVMMDQTGRDA